MRTFSSTSSEGSNSDATIITTTTSSSSSLSPLLAAAAGANAIICPLGATLHGDVATSPDSTQTKCATVTMMLADRIIRNDRTVEDEHFYEANHMNVWQTLEFLSGITLRKRYNYEGYSDNNNSIRTLAPSWRRDSFVEKNVGPIVDESTSNKTSASTPETGNGKYSVVSGNVNASLHNGGNSIAASNTSNVVAAGPLPAGNSSAAGVRFRVTADKRVVSDKTAKTTATKNDPNSKTTKSRRRPSRKRRGKQKIRIKDLDPEYALSPADYADLIKCTFNLPRISAALERLMGTNVVRLTDRNYMKELRERIEDDYRQNLQKRIKARELKEVERERILIIEGKTKVIPDEMADDPIFVVDKKADLEVTKHRAKLKTNREKNSDRLKQQGVKWQRERLKHEDEENQRIDLMRQRHRNPQDLNVEYTQESVAEDLGSLKIEEDEWPPCEQKLKEFLLEERAKMKQRSQRIPTPFKSDPKDMQQILRARKRFHEAEMRIRKHIDEQLRQQQQQQQVAENGLLPLTEDDEPACESTNSRSPEYIFEAETECNIENATASEEISADDTFNVPQDVTYDDGSDLSGSEPLEESNMLHMAKQRFNELLEQDLETDVTMPKDASEQIHYEDEKIKKLKKARNIRELYQLAEAIIIGEHLAILRNVESVEADNDSIEA